MNLYRSRKPSLCQEINTEKPRTKGAAVAKPVSNTGWRATGGMHPLAPHLFSINETRRSRANSGSCCGYLRPSSAVSATFLLLHHLPPPLPFLISSVLTRITAQVIFRDNKMWTLQGDAAGAECFGKPGLWTCSQYTPFSCCSLDEEIYSSGMGHNKDTLWID